ncbi:MAG: hypothetical protein ACE15D_08435 [Candidatus Eisenbacteria bacterium]|nr:hypothetical protein [Candidatus Eisenbacteria bacterium]
MGTKRPTTDPKLQNAGTPIPGSRLVRAARPLLPALAALLLWLPGCGGGGGGGNDQAAGGQTGGATEQTAQDTTGTQPANAAPTVEATLTEFTIQMPDTVRAGSTRFHVVNAGTMEHGFHVEGQGIDKALATSLMAGQMADLDVDLVPGTYRVYCPVGDHSQRGMTRNLIVVP